MTSTVRTSIATLGAAALVVSSLAFASGTAWAQTKPFTLSSPDLATGVFSNQFVLNGFGCQGGNVSPAVSPYGVYPASDGPFIIASANHNQFVSLCKVMGHPEWSEDPRFNWEAMPDLNTADAEIRSLLGEIAESNINWKQVTTLN